PHIHRAKETRRPSSGSRSLARSRARTLPAGRPSATSRRHPRRVLAPRDAGTDRAVRQQASSTSSWSDPGEAMLERRIPRTGESIPAIGLGTWQVFDVAGDDRAMALARETLRVFVEKGGRVVDSSPMYGSSESVTGRLAAELGAREKLFVATKVWTTGRQAGIRQMEDSLRKLGVERLDLMQVHNLTDVQTHLAILGDWKRAGRIRYLGITHYHAGAHAELASLIARGDIDFVQVNYSLAEPEA